MGLLFPWKTSLTNIAPIAKPNALLVSLTQ